MRLFFLFFNLIIFSFSFSQEWQRVYLATFPRSGNHWTRYIIEEATGIATSSVYRDNDPMHLENIFPWGGYCVEGGYIGSCRYASLNEIIVLKTHNPIMVTNFDNRPCIKKIRIVRNPIDIFYSFFKYQINSEVKKLPTSYIEQNIRLLNNFENYWNEQDNVITFKYEELLENPFENFKIMIKEMGYNVSDADILRAIEKNPPFGHEMKHIDKYTQEDLNLIKTELHDFLNKYNYHILQ